MSQVFEKENLVQDLCGEFPSLDRSLVEGVLDINNWDRSECILPLRIISGTAGDRPKKTVSIEDASRKISEEIERFKQVMKDSETLSNLEYSYDDNYETESSISDSYSSSQTTESQLSDFYENEERNALFQHNEKLKNELSQKDMEIQRLTEELEKKYIIKPDLVHLALREIQYSFVQLVRSSKESFDKVSEIMQRAISFIDTTMTKVRLSALRLKNNVKSQIEHGNVLEMLINFTKTFGESIQNTIKSISDKSLPTPGSPIDEEETKNAEKEKEILEEYLKAINEKNATATTVQRKLQRNSLR